MKKQPILVVADRLKTRKSTVMILREAGYEVRAVPTSEEAVAHTQTPDLPYFLALVDLNIHNGAAMQVLRQLSQHSPKTLSVAITRHAEEPVIQEAFQAGAKGFVHSVNGLGDLKQFLPKLEQESTDRQSPAEVGAA